MQAAGLPRADAGVAGALWFALASVLCALIAAFAVVHALRGAERVAQVVVAREVVPPMALVPDSAVAVADVPLAAVPAGALRSAAAVRGRLARLGLAPGEVVTATALSGGVTGASAVDAQLAGLARVSACGARRRAGVAGCLDLVATSLPLGPDQGFALVNPGDRVDVLATYTSAVGLASQIVCQDVPVLDKIGGAATTGPGSGTGAASGWLVLGVTPTQALRLQLVQAEGKAAVLLRPVGAPPEPASVGQQVLVTSDLAGAEPPAVAGVLP